MIRAKIIGAGGYGGVGISELLKSHPEAEIGALVDIEGAGSKLSDLYPHLTGFVDNEIVSPDDSLANEEFDVVFMATPDGVGMKLAGGELGKGAKVIDYSGDFRFNTSESYAEYAGKLGLNPDHASPDLLVQSVYGLAELHKAEINEDRKIVGNPGCFAASCILGLSPAVDNGLISNSGIICDCKTGVSGAGKNANPAFHYPARYDQMNAYKLAGHQHVCEIERELSLLAEEDINVTFTAQVVPVCRGIMSTLYGTLTNEIDEETAVSAYKEFYNDAAFVRVYGSDAVLGSQQVRGTNFCNIVVSVDNRTGILRIVSYIDNLVKGQAGSAMQNMNLIFGMPEIAGLDKAGIYP